MKLKLLILFVAFVLATIVGPILIHLEENTVRQGKNREGYGLASSLVFAVAFFLFLLGAMIADS